MINTLLEKLLLRKLKKASIVFHQGKYEDILRVYKRPLDGSDLSVIYQNIFRVLCLIKLSDDRWESEYLSLMKEGDLDILGHNDKLYIQKYIAHNLDNPEVDPNYYATYSLKEVSKETKSFFPMVNVFSEL